MLTRKYLEELNNECGNEFLKGTVLLASHVINSHMEALDTIESQSAELSRLRAENEGLRQDAARLDWLEKRSEVLLFSVDTVYGNQNVKRIHIPWFFSRGTFRESIDAAMSKKGNNATTP